MTVDFQTALSILRAAENVAVLTHINPDGDTVGSAYALTYALRSLGKKARVENSAALPERFDFLKKDGDENFKAQTVISVDVASKSRLGGDELIKYGGRVDLSIDHHEFCTPFAAATYLEADSACACEIVYLFIKALGAEIDADIASCLYTGLSTDTGCFRYPNTTPRTHRIAAELIEMGARHAEINKALLETVSREQLSLESRVFEAAQYYFGGRAVVLTIPQELILSLGADYEDSQELVARSKNIRGVTLAITIKEKGEGLIQVSVRTNEGVNAARLCAEFGGGGHVRAAGCSFKGLTAEQVKERLLDAAGRALCEGETA